MAAAKNKKKPALSFDDLYRFNLEYILCLVKHEEHAKTCFEEMYRYLDRRSKRRWDGPKHFLGDAKDGWNDADTAMVDSLFFSDDIIYRMVADGEANALDILDKVADDQQGKMVKAMILIHMTSFFYQAHQLTKRMMDRDFWNVVDGGKFLDGHALSFYLFHAMRNRVFEDLPNKHVQMKKMGENYSKLFSDEDDVVKTRAVLSTIVESIHKKVREELDSKDEMISVFFRTFAKHFDSNNVALAYIEERLPPGDVVLGASIMELASIFLIDDESEKD